MSGILLGFAVVVVLTGVGVLAAVIAPTTAHRMQSGLSPVIYYISNPALMFTLTSHADVRAIATVNAPVALLTAVGAALVTALVLRFAVRRDVRATVMGAMSSSYTNAGNIGVPIALYAVGTADPAISVLMVQLLILAPVYLSVFSLLSQFSGVGSGTGTEDRGKRETARMILRSVLSPVTLGTAVGVVFALCNWQLPTFLSEPVDMLGHSSVPMLLVMFGIGLVGRWPLGDAATRVDTLVASLVKVLLMPAIAWILGAAVFGLEREALLAVVVMAGLPTAQNVYLFGHQFQMPTRVASDTAVLSFLLTLPLTLLAAWLILS